MTTEDATEQVVQMAQVLLSSLSEKSLVTPELINEKINLVAGLNSQWAETLDRQKAADELIRRFSLWIGEDTILKNNDDHVQWLNSFRKKEWRYWRRYIHWLGKFLPPSALESLDESTDTILSLLEDPLREGQWSRKGLVVGHVQSGKTSNYAGLICKAADAGYKIIIVLAGLHNNLRAQTQARLDESFLGYETKSSTGDLSIIGVGEIDSDLSIRPNFATNRSEKGDFSTRVFKSLGISPEQRPWLFVVKKNKTVLDRLVKWIRNYVANTVDLETGKRLVTHLPLLLIDDEADHASVDTEIQIFDNDGNPDVDHEPKAINSLIRKILFSFSRTAYVGYTATPFANIFIHERNRTKEEGEDLFPSSFIINLAAPSNYVGPARVFGLISPDRQSDGFPLTRIITDSGSSEDYHGWIPSKHKKGHRPLFDSEYNIPPSLVESIDAFMLACAVRILRNQEKHHSSMLIHVTRFNSVQSHVAAQVTRHVKHMTQRLLRGIEHHAILARLKSLWKDDFLPTNFHMRRHASDLVSDDMPPWEDVEHILADIASDIQIITINGRAKEALEYTKKHVAGMRIIAIGGDKLSRGLTLEGLITSYFLRASRMYDTLMQMGRWFGYRPGYLDLCRLYITDELAEWFQHIADASEELRQEFDMMATVGATPRDYGLKVQSHPVLMVTSRVKMRSARKLYLSYSGTVVETVALYRDQTHLSQNLEITRDFIDNIGAADEKNPKRVRRDNSGKNIKQIWKDSYVWNSVPASSITDFLARYQTHPSAYKVNSDLICEFIESMALSGELTQWTVALFAGGSSHRFSLNKKVETVLVERRPNNPGICDRYSIGRLLSPRDEAIDLDEEAWLAALNITKEKWRDHGVQNQANDGPSDPSGPAIREVRGKGAAGVKAHPERGLLLLYILDPETALIESRDYPPVAFGISFPSSNSGNKVQYVVQAKLWEEEYGLAE